MRYGLIAGGGKFPVLVLQEARRLGHHVVAIAIQEEASKEIQQKAERCHWISLGELSKLIKILHQERITEAVMAGRVRHARIFSSIRPDWKLLKLLTSLPHKNTDSLIGAVADLLATEGIHLRSSIELLHDQLAESGTMTSRKPTADEAQDIDYGRHAAMALAGFDIGQTVVICERACLAVEAIEGTNEVILRAGRFSNGRRITVVKVSKPEQDFRFDVPVVGPTTIDKMEQVNATALALDAGKTLMIDRHDLLRSADEAGIAVVGYGSSSP